MSERFCVCLSSLRGRDGGDYVSCQGMILKAEKRDYAALVVSRRSESARHWLKNVTRARLG